MSLHSWHIILILSQFLLLNEACSVKNQQIPISLAPPWSWLYDCWIYYYLYVISAYHHQRCEFKSRSWRGVLDTTSCDKVCQCLSVGRWFSLGTLVSSTNNTDRHWNIVESGVKHHNPNPKNQNQNLKFNLSSFIFFFIIEENFSMDMFHCIHIELFLLIYYL